MVNAVKTKLSVFKSMKCSKDIPLYDMFYSRDILGEIIQSSSSAPASMEDQKVLDDNLQAFGLSRVEMPKDGNCLFRSIFFGISQMLNSADDKVIQHLQAFDLRGKTDDEAVVSLRNLMVKEWRSKKEHYMNYLTTDGSSSFEELTGKFLSLGHYAGEFRDLMISGISNAVGLPVAVLTSTPNFPMITVFPEDNSNAENFTLRENTICLAFTASGSGHYDAVAQINSHVPSHNSKVSDDSTSVCQCGRNAKNQNEHCCNKPNSRYLCRCPCLKRSMGCTQHCKCTGCANPCGRHESGNTNIEKATRKRKIAQLWGRPEKNTWKNRDRIQGWANGRKRQLFCCRFSRKGKTGPRGGMKKFKTFMFVTISWQNTRNIKGCLSTLSGKKKCDANCCISMAEKNFACWR